MNGLGLKTAAAIVRTYKWQFLTITVVFVIFFMLLMLSIGKRSTPPIATPPPTTAQQKLFFPKPVTEEATFSGYLNTEINKTTQSEIENLPNRVAKTQLNDTSYQYSYISPSPRRLHLLITESNLLAFKNAVTIDPLTYQQPKANQFKQIYGTPEADYTGSESYGRFAQTLIYSSQGFAMIINPYTDEVFEVQSFTPCSLQDYIQKWGSDIKEFPKQEDNPL